MFEYENETENTTIDGWYLDSTYTTKIDTLSEYPSYRLPMYAKTVPNDGYGLVILMVSIEKEGKIYMVSLLYANDNFETTNNVAKFDVDIVIESQTYSQSYVLETSLDKKNNKVYLEALVTVMGSVQYSNLEVDYDFKTKTLKSYRFVTNVDVIGQYVDMGLTADGKYMWYDTTNATDEFAVAVEAEKTALTIASNNVTKLTTKFSSEIQVYMDVIQKVMTEMN